MGGTKQGIFMCKFIEENGYNWFSFIGSTQAWPRGIRLEGEGVFICVIGCVLKRESKRFVEPANHQIGEIGKVICRKISDRSACYAP